MQRSIFLAKLIGPLFFFMGVSLVVNNEAFRLMADQLLRSETPAEAESARESLKTAYGEVEA